MPAGTEEVGVVFGAEDEVELELEAVGGRVGVRGVANWAVEVEVVGWGELG